MQVRPILYTVLITLGFALLANSWVINSEESTRPMLQTSNMSTLPAPITLPSRSSEVDTLRLEREDPPAVRYDTSDVSASIQDLILEARIKKQLFKNENLRSERISVQSIQGRVLLKGQVSSPETKRIVESTVKRVRGVKELDSTLKPE